MGGLVWQSVYELKGRSFGWGVRRCVAGKRHGSPCMGFSTDSFCSQFPNAPSHLGPGHTEQENSVTSSSKFENQSYTLSPDHKHHACHWSMPNNMERRTEVRGVESTETAHGG